MGEQRPSLSEMENYLGRVRGVIIATEDAIGSPADGAHQLADHGEPAEALVQLAWFIDGSGRQVPGWIVDAIRELGDNLIDPSHLPPDLDQWGSS